MAVKNKPVEIKGGAAKLVAMQLVPQQDGNIVILVSGETTDTDGRPVALKDGKTVYQPGASDAMDDLMRAGLDMLRKANDLEDGPITLEPVADVVAKLRELRAAANIPPPPNDPDIPTRPPDVPQPVEAEEPITP